MNPQNLKLDERPFLEFISMFPIILAVFPVPLLFPIGIVGLSKTHIENLPATIFYFVWLIAGIVIIWLNEKVKK